MGKKKTTRGVLLTANLPQLQNLIKRDPEGYKEEVCTHSHQYDCLEDLNLCSVVRSAAQPLRKYPENIRDKT
jgi:protein SDA1